jgi:hypothetical protein
MTLPQKTQDALDHGREGMTAHESGMFSADGPDAVQMVRLFTIRSALDFEVRTGMKMTRVSALAAANDALGTNYKRKATALKAMNELLGVEE